MNQHVPVDPTAPLSEAVAAGKAAREAPGKRQSLTDELRAVLNRHSAENTSGSPDFILAEYMMDCLTAFNAATNRREAWYGREQDPRFGTPKDGIR